MTAGDSRRRQGTEGDGGGLSVNTGNRDEIQETVGASGCYWVRAQDNDPRIIISTGLAY